MKIRITLRRILLLILLLIILFTARPISFFIYTYFQDKKSIKTESTGYTNDASFLNKTKIDTILKVAEDINGVTKQLGELILRAKIDGKKISIAGARHSMGGHTISSNGIIADMGRFNYMKFDSLDNSLTVGSGALWSAVIPYLDKFGKSISVMQSNNSFSVGGSVSVNCHGWQINSPPISSTVLSLRLINSEGMILNCSRLENPELFSLVLGGYGLFGIILDVKLSLAQNKMYRVHQFTLKSEEYISTFEKYTKGKSNIEMAYGRINVNPENFMEEAILSIFTFDNKADLKPLQKSSYVSLRRTVYRGSANSKYGKNLRWKAEKLAATQVNGSLFSRNQLLNEEVDVFQNTDTLYTDILHEYFIPKESVIHFIKELRTIIPRHKVDLLNITIRNVDKDEDSYLSYANEDVFGFVMLFNQERNKEADLKMQTLTRQLIDVAIKLKGTYYLPYRLHASREQMHRVYPQAQEFFRLKRQYDSSEIFQNYFYQGYK